MFSLLCSSLCFHLLNSFSIIHSSCAEQRLLLLAPLTLAHSQCLLLFLINFWEWFKLLSLVNELTHCYFNCMFLMPSLIPMFVSVLPELPAFPVLLPWGVLLKLIESHDNRNYTGILHCRNTESSCWEWIDPLIWPWASWRLFIFTCLPGIAELGILWHHEVKCFTTLPFFQDFFFFSPKSKPVGATSNHHPLLLLIWQM